MVAALSDDLILEIISYLPLKFLVQCKCLNKNFNLFISDPLFQTQHAFRSSTTFDCLLHHSVYRPLCSMSKVDLHQSHDDTIDTKLVPELILQSSCSSGLTLPSIISSSGGLLLLDFCCHDLCVFNPVTGAYRLIPSLEARYIRLSLVTQLTDPSSYKLVAICIQVENKMCGVFKIFDSDASNWRISHATISPNQVQLIDHIYHEAYHITTYLDDSLYWLKNNGEILVFNVKTEQVKIINQPKDVKKIWPCFIPWFGTVNQNKLAMAINNASDNRISIYLYDSVHGKWKVDKVLDCVNVEGYNHFYPVFYDGKHLIQLVTKTGQKKEVYMYDAAANSSRKIKTMTYDTLTFKHFFGTLAKIPHCSYIQQERWKRRKHGLIAKKEEDILEILFRLQKYISQYGL